MSAMAALDLATPKKARHTGLLEYSEDSTRKAITRRISGN